MNTTNNQVIDSNKHCEHCNRTFIRESTLQKHLCEQKRRWLEKDKLPNRIGYSAWKTFYETHHPSKKGLEYRDFVNNNYYSAFVRFGTYCTDIKAINPTAFAMYLIKNQTPIDNWNSDKSYTKYLLEYLRHESWHDAVKRSIDHLLNISNDENIRLGDVFKYANTNKLCYMITMGRISPWVLYHSASGKDFLSKLDTTQTNMIIDYIDPQKWNIKFKREAEDITEVKQLLNSIPL